MKLVWNGLKFLKSQLKLDYRRYTTQKLLYTKKWAINCVIVTKHFAFSRKKITIYYKTKASWNYFVIILVSVVNLTKTRA